MDGRNNIISAAIAYGEGNISLDRLEQTVDSALNAPRPEVDKHKIVPVVLDVADAERIIWALDRSGPKDNQADDHALADRIRRTITFMGMIA